MLKHAKIKVDSVLFEVDKGSPKASVEIAVPTYNKMDRLKIRFMVDNCADTSCISINSLFDLGYTEDILCDKSTYSSHDYIVGCTSDKIETFVMELGELEFNGFVLSNFSMNVILPNDYVKTNKYIQEQNEVIIAHAKDTNDIDFMKKHYRPQYDLPNLLGLDILRYFVKETEYPYFDRNTGRFSRTDGYMYIKLADKYYKEFKNEKVLGTGTDLSTYYLPRISFEESFNPIYVDDIGNEVVTGNPNDQVTSSSDIKSNNSGMFELPDTEKIFKSDKHKDN